MRRVIGSKSDSNVLVFLFSHSQFHQVTSIDFA